LHAWSKATLKSMFLPGGVLLFISAAMVYTGVATLALPGLVFVYYAALVAGLFLAWRFHSSRAFFALLVLFLAQQALVLSSAGHAPNAGPAGTVLTAVGLLVPLNFALLALSTERGFTVASLAPTGLFLFVQSVVVAVLSSSDQSLPSAGRAVHHLAPAIALPGYVLFAFSIAAAVLLGRFFLSRQPVESALFWSLIAFYLSLRFGATPRTSITYAATATFVLAASIVEASYLLAYHDELTTLPSRRAFKDALARLQAPYSIAMVDIDHFKKFNDTYGHDTGDQVLRLVASKLARVSGGGRAYRCGGEEFAICFPGKTTPETLDHLENLRSTIEAAAFRMRSFERRQMPRGPDRRNQRAAGRARAGHAIRQLAQPDSPAPVSVTVSIGVATSPKIEGDPDQVIQAADKALYRAKASGRNRVESAASPRRPARAKTAGIA